MQSESTSSSLRSRLLGAIGIVSLAVSFGFAANGATAAPGRGFINEGTTSGNSVRSLHHHATSDAPTWVGNAARNTIR